MFRMSTRTLLYSLSVSLAALVLGCKSAEPHDRAATTADHVVALGNAAGEAQVNLDKAANALDDVSAKAAVDPVTAFDAYKKSLAAFSDSYMAMKNKRAAIADSARTWFDDFQKQNGLIQDEDLRKLGEDRLATFRAKIDDVKKQVDELVTSTDAVETQMNNLRTFLSNDLTADGIKSASGRISDTSKDARKSASGLGKLAKGAGGTADKLRAARPPPPAPAPAK